MKNRHAGQLLLSLPIRILRWQLKHLEAGRTRIERPEEPAPSGAPDPRASAPKEAPEK
jgi:hypothetical protein